MRSGSRRDWIRRTSCSTATRNRVRHEVMPTLRRLNPRIDDALARFAMRPARTRNTSTNSPRRLSTPSRRPTVPTCLSPGANSPHYHGRSPRESSASPSPQVHGSVPISKQHTSTAVLDALQGHPAAIRYPGGITATIDQTSLIIGKGSLPHVSLDRARRSRGTRPRHRRAARNRGVPRASTSHAR